MNAIHQHFLFNEPQLQIYNLLQNVSEFCKVLAQVSFATSKTELDILYENLCIRAASRVAERLRLKNFGN